MTIEAVKFAASSNEWGMIAPELMLGCLALFLLVLEIVLPKKQHALIPTFALFGQAGVLAGLLLNFDNGLLDFTIFNGLLHHSFSGQVMRVFFLLASILVCLLARPSLDPEECRELSALIHQTYRLSNVIEDLLLLSRMDAGRLKIEFGPVNLGQLIEAALDDLGALPDELGLKVETDLPATLFVAGEKRYLALILQNLLENARKYNRPEGRLRIAARATDDAGVVLAVGNTGPTIPPAAQAHIFERFHRGSAGENVPGYGLGLNLAHELARLHGGELRLVRSADDWTEFIVRLQAAPVTAEAFS